MQNSQNKGWVRLHRQIEDNFLWFSEPFTKAQAWIDLFLNANHKEGMINIRGNIISIKRGQIGWSELTMVKRWKWSKDKVRRFLRLLENEQQIIQQKDRFITTIITIIKYEDYQNGIKTIQQTEQQKDSRQYINKNDKNEKKDMSSNDDPHNQIKELFNLYTEKYKEWISDEKPIFNWGACEKLAKPHVKSLGLEKMKHLLLFYLKKAEDKDREFWKENAYSLQVFLSANTLNKLNVKYGKCK